jgi:hypothetical protein
VQPDGEAAQHHHQRQADPQHHVDLLAARLEPDHLGQRGQRPVLVAFGVLEGAEEQQDGQEVEQQFHAAACTDSALPGGVASVCRRQFSLWA